MENLMTVSDFASQIGITKQGAYKLLKGKLSEYLVMDGDKKMVKPSVLKLYGKELPKESEPKEKAQRSTASKVDLQKMEALIRENEQLQEKVQRLEEENAKLTGENNELKEVYKKNRENFRAIASMALRANELI